MQKVPSHLRVGDLGWNKKVPKEILPQTLGKASQLLKSGERLSELISINRFSKDNLF